MPRIMDDIFTIAVAALLAAIIVGGFMLHLAVALD